MKILLVYSDTNANNWKKPIEAYYMIYYGLSVISSILKQNGHDTKLIVLTKNTPLKFVYKQINDFAPDAIGYSTVASEYDTISAFAKKIKRKYPHIFSFIGGVHATISPDESMLDIFDSICIGEGEFAVLELVERLKKKGNVSGINNFWFKKPDGCIEKNPTRNFIEDLNILPFADRKIWNEWINYEIAEKIPSVILGRGCPYNCSNCCNHALKKIAKGNYVRLRSVENIIKEIDSLEEHYCDFETVYLEIETFGVDYDWSIKLCDALAEYNNSREKKYKFGINLRISPSAIKVLPDLFLKMREANFEYVNAGLETASLKLRQKMLNRFYSNNDILECVKIAKGYQIKVLFYLMLGLPGETIEDYNATVDFIRDNNLDFTEPSVFYPYPGTNLYNYCHDNLLIKKNKKIIERLDSVLKNPEFSKAKLRKAKLWFQYYVYEGKYPFKKLYKMMKSKYRYVYPGFIKRKLIPIFILLDAFLPTRSIRNVGGGGAFSVRFFIKYITDALNGLLIKN